MRWIKVDWERPAGQAPDDEPVTIISEVGDDDYETRRVERYADGRLAWADASVDADEISLAEKPIGALEEIAAASDADSRFVPSEITRDEFERQWAAAGV
ncbi:DUF6881 domain-containing protein [Actinomadura geliboluensis]|uniref:DUF6881 domain-containing protein n=1 Tax=Actinomadura geliboluensis TaxID=882440 RepID=UPI00371BA7E0